MTAVESAPTGPARTDGPARHARRVAILALGLALVGAAIRYGPATPPGRALIARLLGGQKVGSLGWLTIGGIAGDPWTDFTIDRIEIRDRRGAWISARAIAIRWNPLELARRRVRIGALTIGRVTVDRAPILLASGPGPSSSPVSLRIDALAARVETSAAIASRPGDYRLAGAIDLERRGAVSGRIAAESLTHAGDFLRVGFDIDRRRLNLEAHAREAMGGALAGGLGLDPRQPFLLDARAHGSPRAGWFDLASRHGALSPAVARGAWSAAGGEAFGAFDMTASRWLAPWRDRVGPRVTFHLAARQLGRDLYRVAFQSRGETVDLAGEGNIDPGRRRTDAAGLAIRVGLTNLSTLTTIPGLGAARLSGLLTGEAARWRLAGEASLDRVQGAGLTLARLSGPIEVRTDPGSGLHLRAQAAGAGGTGEGPAAALLGAAPRGEVQVDWLGGGRVLVRRLSIRGAAIDIDGEGERGLWGALAFKGNVRVHDVPALVGARGQILADWRAAQGSAAAPWTFGVTARGVALKLAQPIADGLLGPSPSLRADGRFGSGGLAVDKAVLDGAAGSMTGAGSVGPAGALNARIEASGKGMLSLGSVSITGPYQATGVLTGTLARPQLQESVAAQWVGAPAVLDQRLRDPRLTLTVLAEGGALTGRVALAGASDQGRATAESGFRFAGRRLELTGLDVRAGGAAIAGGAVLDAWTPEAADLTFTLEPGAFLKRGRLQGTARLAAAPAGPRETVSIVGSGLVFPGDAAELGALTLSADGPARHLPYRLEAKGAVSGIPARLAGSGILGASLAQPAATFSGAGRFGASDFRTLSPAELTFGPGGPTGALHIGVDRGRADVTLTRVGGRATGRAVIADLNLGVLDPDLRGKVDGVLTVTRQGGGLVGTITARVSGVSSRDLGGSSPLAGAIDVGFGGGMVTASGQLTDGKGSRLSADLQLPATLSITPPRLEIDPHRSLTGKFAADGEIGPIWDLLSGGGQILTGHLLARGEIGGVLADPRLTGVAAIDNGEFEDGAVGLRLKAVTARADLLGDAIDVTRLSATDSGKGMITGAGRLGLVRNGASSFRLTLADFRLFDTTLGQAAASGTVNVDRGGDGRVRLGGALVIDRALISPSAPTPSGVVPMAVVEIHGPAEAGAAARAPAERAPPVTLDIALKAPGGLLIKGRGLNLEMSMDAHVAGTTASPSLTGFARVVRGDYDFAGQRFQVADGGSVSLGTTAEAIHLDLTATRDDPTLTAVIKIGGTAAEPTLTLSSTPPLPKDEILSQVLFGASAAQLTGLEAAQLASAVAGLAGNGGFDVIGGLRNFAHLDRLAIDTTATTGTTFAGGRYVSNRVYVELLNGARIGQGAQVEWRLKKHIAVISRVTSQGDHAVSVRWRKDY